MGFINNEMAQAISMQATYACKLAMIDAHKDAQAFHKQVENQINK